MRDKLCSALTQIRELRSGELSKYKPVPDQYGDQEVNLKKRRAILTLELPFRTDSQSLFEARAAAYEEKETRRNKHLGIDSTSEISKSPEGWTIIKKQKKGSENAYKFLEKWWRTADESTRQARRTLYVILKEAGALPHNLSSKEQPLKAEDLVHTLPLENMERIINNIPDIAESTRSAYLSHARSLRDHLARSSPTSSTLTGRRSRLSLEDIEKLFEFLEARALKSTTERAYHDVLIVRGLLYIDLPAKEFFSLGPPDELNLCVRSGDKAFPIPASLITLWKACDVPDRLFLRKYDERQLHKKIRRFGEYAHLSTLLTPSILKSSLESIYRAYLYLSPDVRAHLPTNK